MRWDATPNAGFTPGRPWLPVGPEVASVNVEAERHDEGSMLNLYGRLLDLRRREPALASGSWESLGAHGAALAYLRTHGGRAFMIALNLGPNSARLEAAQSGRVAISTHPGREGDRVSGTIELQPDEGVVIEIRASTAARRSKSDGSL